VTTLLAASAFAVYVAERPRARERPHQNPAVEPTNAPTGAPKASAEPHADPVSVPGPALVTIHMTTEPNGASVQLEGGAQVCATTPCAFDVLQGTPIVLHAHRGQQQARAALRPSSATDLHLVLNAPPRRPAAAQRGLGSQDDLKVPEIFRDPR
jgi:hypothetical protein